MWAFTRPTWAGRGRQQTNAAGAHRLVVADLHLRHGGAERYRSAGASTGANNVTSNDAVTGTADANATVTLTEGSTVLGSTTANASGVWAFTPTGLTQGAQTITASETNAAGLTGSSSLTFTYEPPRRP